MIPISDGFADVHKPGVSKSGAKIAITPFRTRACKPLGFSGSLLPQRAGLGDLDGQFLDPCHNPPLFDQGWQGDFVSKDIRRSYCSIICRSLSPNLVPEGWCADIPAVAHQLGPIYSDRK